MLPGDYFLLGLIYYLEILLYLAYLIHMLLDYLTIAYCLASLLVYLSAMHLVYPAYLIYTHFISIPFVICVSGPCRVFCQYVIKTSMIQ